MHDKQIRPGKPGPVKHYIRICPCGYEEDYMGDDQKCGGCGKGVPFKVEKR